MPSKELYIHSIHDFFEKYYLLCRHQLHFLEAIEDRYYCYIHL